MEEIKTGVHLPLFFPSPLLFYYEEDGTGFFEVIFRFCSPSYNRAQVKEMLILA